MKGFYNIWAWRPSWSCDLDFLYTHWFPLPIDASYKIWLWLAKRFQRRRSLKLWTDGRTDAGRTPDHGHPISSPCEPNGSGELKTQKNMLIELSCMSTNYRWHNITSTLRIINFQTEQPARETPKLDTVVPCNHLCHNKQLCAHECCKTGVSARKRQQRSHDNRLVT